MTGKNYRLEKKEFIQGDCIEVMESRKFHPDLIITDPPYGIGIDKWDNKIPDDIYFKEMFRIGKNLIIFGGNYFKLPHTQSWLCWDKTYKFNQNIDIGEFELIWTSFNHKAKFIRYTCCGNFRGFDNPKADYNKKPNRHICEKPEPVIRWLLNKFSKPDDTVFDPFCGSGSIIVACKQKGLKYIGCEIQQQYVDIANKRLQQSTLLGL